MAIKSEKFKIEVASDPLIEFKGTETADATANLSTLQGSGSVQAPKDTGGWIFTGMIKIQVKDAGNNIVERWIPHYIPEP